ncbi:MAG: prepilin-type N-terminal cleavage/methylation domain-containing protein [Gammaproteobacteria bacterium]|nr:prepilin-type N-terminal cleavage/methylation domain-containing protein [Gammaproteobacteria bacterium]
MKRQSSQSGFTLIEIAIVLVIVGLLLGGVLKGQELITNAKIKRITNDFNAVSAAIYSYLDRYGQLPGDDNTAAARWGAEDGNGDGVIGIGNGSQVWTSTTATEETAEIWDHLRRANLLSGGSGINQPRNAFGGIIGVEDTIFGMPGPVICMANLIGSSAEIVDINIDNGVGDTGGLRGSTDGSTATTYTQTGTFTICRQM